MLDENAEMQGKLERVYDEIVEVVAQIDDILLQQTPQVEADYQVKIGCYEQELLRAQIDARRAKRKLQMAQADINRGIELADARYEEELKEELAAWNAALKQAMAAYDDAIERRAGSHAMSADDSDHMKRCYRKLAKRLHPDLHPELSEEEAKRFILAQKAYENGDLELLESIEAATRHMDSKLDFEGLDAPALEAELIAAEAQLAAARARLSQVEESYPYCMREKLADADWVCETVANLRSQIAEQNEACATYVAAYERLLEEERGHERIA